MKKHHFIIGLIFFLGNLSITLYGQTTTEKLNQTLSLTFQNSNIPGMAIAIVSKDKILYQNQFGYADIVAKTPFTQNTIQNIGSTSKTFIGMAIMQLVDQGKLTLDTKINTVLPFKVTNPYHPEQELTIRQLATHTSSIKDRTFNYDLKAYVSDDNAKGNRKGLPFINKVQFKRMLKNEDIALETFLENTLNKKGKWYKKKNFHKHAPGTKEEYSNIGAALAGYIVELVTGEKYADYVVNHILKPLKMDASGWTIGAESQTNFAKRYIKGTPVPTYHLTTYPDGGLYSSVADLSTYLMAMIRGYKGEGKLISQAAYQQMMSNQFEQGPIANSIEEGAGRQGLFWDVFDKGTKGDVGHNGSDPGILSFMYFNPEKGVGYLFLTNTGSEGDDIQSLLKMWESMVKYSKEF